MFKKSWGNPYLSGIMLFLFCLEVQGFWLASFFPAAMTNDSFAMWWQSKATGSMGNLQPYLYTWILSLLRMINDSPAIIASLQVVVSAALVSGLSIFLLRKGANKWLIAGGYLAFVFSIPVMITNTIIHRDSLYAELVLLLSIVFVALFFREKEISTKQKVLLGLLLTLIASLRYDGAIYLLLAPILLYFFKLMNLKGIMWVMATALLGYFFVQIPLAGLLNVKNDRYLQIYNLETKFVGAVYHDHPETFSQSDLVQMTEVAPLDIWKAYDPTDDIPYWTKYKFATFSSPSSRKQWDSLCYSKVLRYPGSIIKDRYFMTLGLLRGEKVNGPEIVKNEINMKQSPLTTRATRDKLSNFFLSSYQNAITRFFFWSPLYLIVHAVFLVFAIIKKKTYLVVYILISLASFLAIIPLVTSGQFRYMYPLFYTAFFVPALYTLDWKRDH